MIKSEKGNVVLDGDTTEILADIAVVLIKLLRDSEGHERTMDKVLVKTLLLAMEQA